MNKVNEYFFGEEEISLHDALWFYGMYAVTGIIAVPTILIGWFG